MSEFGPFHYRVEEAEAVVAGRMAMKARMFRPPAKWLIVAIVVVAVLLLVLDAMDGYLNLASTFALVVVLPLLWVVLLVMAPIQARRQYRQSAQLRDDHTLSFDEDAITFIGSRGTVRIPMAEYREVLAGKGVILLYQTEMFYNLVPTCALGDAADELLRRLEAAGVRRL
ncbi:YcxB family protein [Croceicoccus bisphenolivorans]|uniref:YcxB family protein n=1 Tax=Croceicoccus bisphenolivorans TaxID=1783232 RepID=UPI000830DF47|nr:YcxB family protein [Croceicoccus bisphenolivorans]